MLAFKTFVSLAFPLLVVANPLAVRTDPKTCDNGSLNCCESTKSATDTTLSSSGGLLSIFDLLGSGLVGEGCSPLSVVDVGSNNCQKQTVCCTGNNFSGAVVLGCTPINLNL